MAWFPERQAAHSEVWCRGARNGGLVFPEACSAPEGAKEEGVERN